MADFNFTLKRGVDGADTLYPKTTWTQVDGKPATFTPTAHTIGSHSDVTITSPSTGQVLKYNGTGWTNQVDAAGTGDVVGPASSVNDRIATFDGTTGKLIKDSGAAIAGLATSTHSHGNINNSGQITSATQTVATGDQLLIRDVSNSSLVSNGPVFGTSTTTFLANDGVFRTTGDVVGPASSVTARIATFNGTTGKLIQDSGTLISGLATSTHTHGDISNAGAIATTAVAPASNDYIIISDSSASNVLKRGILIDSAVPNGTFLANNGSMLVASVSKRYTLGSAVTSSLTTFGSTGITFPLVANKYYMVEFNGGIFSAATTTGFGLSVTTSSTTGTPTVRGMFNISSNSTTGGSAAHFQGSFVTMSTTAGTSLNGILGLDNANSAGTPSFVNFSAVMYSGSSEDKTMTIQLRSEIAGSLVTLIAGSTVVVTELTT